jgi:hypothetical protein
MKTTHCFVFSLLAVILILGAGSASAANFVIVNNDGPGEGLNDPSPVAPVGGNTGTTLGEQRLIVLQAAADVWGALIESSVDIRVNAEFNSMSCGVLGSTGPGPTIKDFPGAPVAGTWFHSAIADAISGVDQAPGFGDFDIQYNSDWGTPQCPTYSFYLGLDPAPVGTSSLYSTVLHEMAHGLGFANFVNDATGTWWYGFPDIFSVYTLDMSTGLHWTEMTQAQRQASAVNTGNLVWDGPNVTAEVPTTLYGSTMDLEMTAPPAVAGHYAAAGAIFGEVPHDPVSFAGDIELVNTGSATPTDGCGPLIAFTPGNIAFIDRGTCEFGVKALNAQDAGASAAIIANDRDGTVLVNMAGGVVGDQVTIPLVAIGQNDGNAIRSALPGSGIVTLQARWGMHPAGYALLYAPNPVALGSSVSHFDDTAWPNLLMEPFDNEDVFDQVDLTPAQFMDVGHTIVGGGDIFADGFESNSTGAWSNTVP